MRVSNRRAARGLLVAALVLALAACATRREVPEEAARETPATAQAKEKEEQSVATAGFAESAAPTAPSEQEVIQEPQPVIGAVPAPGATRFEPLEQEPEVFSASDLAEPETAVPAATELEPEAVVSEPRVTVEAGQETVSAESAPGFDAAAAGTEVSDANGEAISVQEEAANPFVFRVTSGPKDPSHPFYGVGSKFGFIVDGVQGKPLILVRGKTYTFKVNTNVQHDFYLSLSETGWGAATYSKGVEGNFTYDGVVTFTPDASTPDVLYYQCRNHKNMGGVIHIVDEGEEDQVKVELAAAPARPAAAPALEDRPRVSKEQVQQKLAFAELFVNQSRAARRIEGSGDAAAQGFLRDARDKLQASRAAFEERRLGQALALVDESLRLMSEASRRVPAESDQAVLQERFKELLQGVETFQASYQRNYQRLSKQRHRKEIPQLDMARIESAKAEARRLAEEGDYDEAVQVLSQVQEDLNNALTDMLHEETMSYELVFETPKEEYEYELARYESYEELIPLAIEQRRPSPQTVELMNRFVEKAKGIKAQALPTAAKGDYETAILMLQGATSQIQRALRLAGVR